MIAERDIREKIAHLRSDLEGWREPDGYLVPTEPDADERALIRARLTGAIFGLEYALGETTR